LCAHELAEVRVLYFGTYERTYPRNAQVIAALRRADVEVIERHAPVWEGREQKWQAGVAAAVRLAFAEARLLQRPSGEFDVVIVGYPGHLDLAAARRAAQGRPVVFNPLVSLYDTFVSDRGRFRSGSAAARALMAIDRRALRNADLVVADTEAHADFLAALARMPRQRVAVCYVGAEERLFHPPWRPPDPFTVLFVGKLIPLHGIETVLAAAQSVREIRFRLVGSGQLEPVLHERPENVDWRPWVPYERLPAELRTASCALGIFGTSAKASRVIPNKVFQALACGTPVVTSDTPAARELLIDHETALLVPPGDAGALATAVRDLAASPELATRIAAAGRRVFEAHASEEALGRRWRSLLEQVAA
jgi:glycosyltransferase involved in cell wall biosynthesis